MLLKKTIHVRRLQWNIVIVHFVVKTLTRKFCYNLTTQQINCQYNSEFVIAALPYLYPILSTHSNRGFELLWKPVSHHLSVNKRSFSTNRYKSLLHLTSIAGHSGSPQVELRLQNIVASIPDSAKQSTYWLGSNKMVYSVIFTGRAEVELAISSFDNEKVWVENHQYNSKFSICHRLISAVKSHASLTVQLYSKLLMRLDNKYQL